MGGEGLAAAALNVPRRGWRGRYCTLFGAQSLAAENPRIIKISATSLAELLARIPKIVLFGVAALVQVALLTLMIIDRVQILREGTEVTLQTRPVDPRDLLRGDYVVLGYDISQLPAGSLLNQPTGTRNPMVFVKLAPKRDGLYEAVSVHAEAVAVTSPDVLIRGRVAYGAP